MTDIADVLIKNALYGVDEYAWIERQIALLRSGDIDSSISKPRKQLFHSPTTPPP